jgi:endonuclease III
VGEKQAINRLIHGGKAVDSELNRAATRINLIGTETPSTTELKFYR